MNVLTFVVLYGLGYAIGLVVSAICIGVYARHIGADFDDASNVLPVSAVLMHEKCFGSSGLPVWVLNLLEFLSWPLCDTVICVYAVRLLKEEFGTNNKEEA